MIIYPRADIDNILCGFFLLLAIRNHSKVKKKKNLKYVLDLNIWRGKKKTFPFINICVITYNLKAKQITKV